MIMRIFQALKATYYRIGLDFIETYHNDALMNGLTLDIHQEENPWRNSTRARRY